MGSWFSYGENKIGQGRENAKQFLIDNNKERKEIVKKVKAFIGVDDDKSSEKKKS
jgi:recombination protein RecA